LIEDIAGNIEFAFAAFGLLMDNAVNHAATLAKIFYHEQVGDFKEKVFRIADNAKLCWTEEEFFKTMSSFLTISIQPPAGIDKKSKTVMMREHLRREYGTNIKLASIRLGSGYLHISFSEDG
jgi:hypothetical protein